MPTTGVLKAKMPNGTWVSIAGQGPPGQSPDVMWVGPDAPTDPATELWYDTDDVTPVSGVMPEMEVNAPSLVVAAGTWSKVIWATNDFVGATALASGMSYSTSGIYLPVGRYQTDCFTTFPAGGAGNRRAISVAPQSVSGSNLAQWMPVWPASNIGITLSGTLVVSTAQVYTVQLYSDATSSVTATNIRWNVRRVPT